MTQLIIQAPAKVNLSLTILAKREDGFHALETLMTGVSLYDQLSMSVANAGIEFTSTRPFGRPEQDLCFRAAEIYFQNAGLDGQGVKIHLEKNIPDGAGLGGGSSDAAAVLLGMEELFPAACINRAALSDMATSLGMDVSFFLNGGTAWCRGRGELVGEQEAIKRHLVLVCPDEVVPTPAVYSKLRLTDQKLKNTILNHNHTDQLCALMRNDLESAAFEVCGVLKNIKEDLESLVHDRKVLLSGSGASFYILCKNEEDSHTISHQVDQTMGLSVYPVKTNCRVDIKIA